MSDRSKPDPVDPLELLDILTAVRAQVASMTGSQALLGKLDLAIRQLCEVYGLKPHGPQDPKH